MEAYEASRVVGKRIAPDGWEKTVKRAAGAFHRLAGQAKTAEAQKTLTKLRDELNALIA